MRTVGRPAGAWHLPLREIAPWWLPGMDIMAGLVMCRQGLERPPPGSDRVTKCAAGQTGECSNSTVTRAAAPTGYRARRAAGPLAVRREFAAITGAAGLGEEWAP